MDLPSAIAPPSISSLPQFIGDVVGAIWWQPTRDQVFEHVPVKPMEFKQRTVSRVTHALPMTSVLCCAVLCFAVELRQHTGGGHLLC